MRHSCTGSANGENGLNQGFMNQEVWKMGGVGGGAKNLRRLLVCQPRGRGAESKTSCVTGDGLWTQM